MGFGRSDKPEASYSLSYYAQFVRGFLDAQGIERAALVANSGGGAIALQAALLFPERVEALVLVASAGLGKEVTLLLRLPTLPLLGEFLTRPNRKRAAQFLGEMYYDPALVTEELVDLFYETSSLPGAQKAFLRASRSTIGLGGVRKKVYQPILDSLGSITVPTLIVWGEQDKILPVAHAHIAKERMPNAQLHIFDQCGHQPMVEHPAQFNKLVLEFLAK